MVLQLDDCYGARHDTWCLGVGFAFACCIVWGLYLENGSGIAHVTSRESNYVHKTVSTGQHRKIPAIALNSFLPFPLHIVQLG